MKETTPQIHLGDLVKDCVSGFEGLALAKMEALYEATQFRIHPKSCKDNGDVISGVWFDEGRLVQLEEKRVSGFYRIAGSEGN